MDNGVRALHVTLLVQNQNSFYFLDYAFSFFISANVSAVTWVEIFTDDSP